MLAYANRPRYDVLLRLYAKAGDLNIGKALFRFRNGFKVSFTSKNKKESNIYERYLRGEEKEEFLEITKLNLTIFIEKYLSSLDKLEDALNLLIAFSAFIPINLNFLLIFSKQTSEYTLLICFLLPFLSFYILSKHLELLSAKELLILQIYFSLTVFSFLYFFFYFNSTSAFFILGINMLFGFIKRKQENIARSVRQLEDRISKAYTLISSGQNLYGVLKDALKMYTACFYLRNGLSPSFSGEVNRETYRIIMEDFSSSSRVLKRIAKSLRELIRLAEAVENKLRSMAFRTAIIGIALSATLGLLSAFISYKFISFILLFSVSISIILILVYLVDVRKSFLLLSLLTLIYVVARISALTFLRTF